MPYIQENRRDHYGDFKDMLEGYAIEHPGELNYLITLLCKSYYDAVNKPGYRTINNVIGALEGAKLEFYRRVAVPYEDEKIEENGDVY